MDKSRHLRAALAMIVAVSFLTVFGVLVLLDLPFVWSLIVGSLLGAAIGWWGARFLVAIDRADRKD